PTLLHDNREIFQSDYACGFACAGRWRDLFIRGGVHRSRRLKHAGAASQARLGGKRVPRAIPNFMADVPLGNPNAIRTPISHSCLGNFTCEVRKELIIENFSRGEMIISRSWL